MNTGVKMGLRALMYHFLMALLCLMLLAAIGNVTLQILLNAALLVGFAMLPFNDGCYLGEKGVSNAALIEKQRAEGRRIDPTLEKQVFRKNNAWVALIVGALPLLILSVVNLACSPLYPLETEAATDSALVEEADDEAPVLFDEQADANAVQPIIWLKIITRIVYMPYVALTSLLAGNEKLLYLLYLPLAFLFPAVEAVGYLNGPRLYQKKLKDIAAGKRRKMRNLRVNKKPRQPKPEV